MKSTILEYFITTILAIFTSVISKLVLNRIENKKVNAETLDSASDTKLVRKLNKQFNWVITIVIFIITFIIILLLIRPPRDDWNQIAPGVAEKKLHLLLDEENIGNLAIVRADINQTKVVVSYSSAGINIANHMFDSQAVAAINGAPFGESEHGGPLGAIIARGVEHQTSFNDNWSGCLICNCSNMDRKIWIGYCRDLPLNDFSTCFSLLQTQIVLVEPDGSSGIKSRSASRLSARSAIALDNNGYVYLISTELKPGHAGIPLYDFARLLAKGPEQVVPCDVALNLDGGRATAMAVRDSPKSDKIRWQFGPCQGSNSVEDNWRTPSAIFIVPN